MVRELTITLHKFAADESGATAIEYGLIAAGISVAIIASVQGVGGKLKTTFNTVGTTLSNAGKYCRHGAKHRSSRRRAC